MYSQKTYSVSPCYRSFKEIDSQSYHTLIRFFEEHAFIIKALDFDEYFEILTSYLRSLFEAGAYQKHADMADVVIEAAIINNLKVYRGEDIYEKTLFQKSASLFHLQKYAPASHILSELIKINPSEPSYRLFLIKTRLQIKPGYLYVLQGLAIVIYLFTILVVSVQTFYLDPFKPEWSPLAFTTRNISLITATFFLMLSDLVFRGRTWYTVNKLAQESKEKIKRGE